MQRTQHFLCLEELIGLPKRTLQEEWEDLLTDDERPRVWQQILKRYNNIPQTDKHLGLTVEEVASLVVYTFEGNRRPYLTINTWLRDTERPPGKYTTTVTNMYTGLVKIARRPENKPRTTYRGIRNTYFEPVTDETGFYGFVWFSFTSCTEDATTNFFGEGTGFVIMEREEDEGGIHKGVKLPDYLTFFPNEAEVIYPPLTVFKILYRSRRGNCDSHCP
eukprot:TRINITY_DN6344_c0_g1_i7.p1 TRINITY_DN6344_c0_g1~~TRINITY_DN6344_c0_g1_i7.p1  ORF type:complete len:219 (-),score=19.31 TRINITY_DN6344_c0_g1_i7:373-1029(-)